MNENTTTKRRQNIVIILYATSAIYGARAVFEPYGVEQIIMPILFALFMAQFCMVDSRIREKPLPWSVSWLIYFTWPVFVPVYLIVTRGIRRLHFVILWVALFIGTSWIAYFATGAFVL